MFEAFSVILYPVPRFLDSKVFYDVIDENDILGLSLDILYETVIKLAGLIVFVVVSNSNIEILALSLLRPVRL